MENKMKIDIGIDAKQREEISGRLSRVVADTYTLYLKTHNFPWNVTGPMLQTLHLMFETQYNELALAVDLVAERIRALGFTAPGSYKQFARLSSIKEEDRVPKAEDMIRCLVDGHETVARTARVVFKAAEGASDQPTCDLLTQRMQVHEKTAWMLCGACSSRLRECAIGQRAGHRLLGGCAAAVARARPFAVGSLWAAVAGVPDTMLGVTIRQGASR
jgi:starvation-inducible DNA-binding protein